MSLWTSHISSLCFFFHICSLKYTAFSIHKGALGIICPKALKKRHEWNDHGSLILGTQWMATCGSPSHQGQIGSQLQKPETKHFILKILVHKSSLHFLLFFISHSKKQTKYVSSLQGLIIRGVINFHGHNPQVYDTKCIWGTNWEVRMWQGETSKSLCACGFLKGTWGVRTDKGKLPWLLQEGSQTNWVEVALRNTWPYDPFGEHRTKSMTGPAQSQSQSQGHCTEYCRTKHHFRKAPQDSLTQG